MDINIYPEIDVILNRVGGDTICLRTDLPSAIPNIDPENETLTIRAQRDTGVEYVRRVFGVEPNIKTLR